MFGFDFKEERFYSSVRYAWIIMITGGVPICMRDIYRSGKTYLKFTKTNPSFAINSGEIIACYAYGADVLLFLSGLWQGGR